MKGCGECNGCERYPTALAGQSGAKGKGGVGQGCQTSSAGSREQIQKLEAAGV